MHGSPVVDDDSVVGMATVIQLEGTIRFTRISQALKNFITNNQYRRRLLPVCISGQSSSSMV